MGKGSYGIVREATLIKDPETKVAVKAMSLEKLSKRFKSICCEVDSLRSCDHPNIVKFVDVFLGQENLYLVTELIDGIDLYDFVQEQGRLSEEDTVTILKQILNTIEYLHSIGVCHRDIKLDNIMINPDTLTIKLLDFGFSTKVKRSEKMDKQLGTPYYIAPEVL